MTARYPVPILMTAKSKSRAISCTNIMQNTPATDFQNEGPAQTLAVRLAVGLDASPGQRSGGGSGGGSGTGGGRWTTSAWLQFISADLSCLHQIITKQDACISNTSHFFLSYLFKDTSTMIMNTENIRKETELEQHCSVLRQAENNFKVSLSERT